MSDSQNPPRVAAKDAPVADRPSPDPSLNGRGANDSSSVDWMKDLDPEIEALLDFEPVARKRHVDGEWTPEQQRQFVARLAATGSPGRASEEMGKTETGVRKLYRSPEAESFRAAWHAAVDLAKRRKTKLSAAKPVMPGSRPPSVDHRRKHERSAQDVRQPGQMLNEHGEWEDEDSLQRRAADARDSISNKLLGARRLFLGDICSDPAKRAAFEILTELPIDWDKAKRLEPQPDEPWRSPNLRAPDMLLTAENGWMGDMTHGPDKKAELLAMINEWRVEAGMEPIILDDGDGAGEA